MRKPLSHTTCDSSPTLASLVKGRGTVEGGGGIHCKNRKGIPQSAPLTAPFDKGASRDEIKK